LTLDSGSLLAESWGEKISDWTKTKPKAIVNRYLLMLELGSVLDDIKWLISQKEGLLLHSVTLFSAKIEVFYRNLATEKIYF
jgi:hypothetical protein